MADSSNSIDIVVKDGVDASIAPKLIAIGDNAAAAEGKISSLKSMLNNISSSGLGQLLTSLNGVGASAGVLAQQTDNLKTKTDAAASSQSGFAAVAARVLASLEAEASAAATLAAELEEEARIQEAVNVGIAAFEGLLADAQEEAVLYAASIQNIAAAHELSQAAIAETTAQEAIWGSTLAETTAQLEAQGTVWAATFDERRVITLEETVLLENQKFATDSLTASEERLLEIQSLVSSVMGESSAATVGAAEATAAKTVADRAGAAATQGVVSANVSAAAGLGILEGRTLSMNRAAANFITRILGLGPILQQAFVVIGAVALIAVIYQAVSAFDKFIDKAKNAGAAIGAAFDGVIDPLRKTNDSLAVTNDKLDQTIAKLEHKPTTNGAVLALDQAREAADKLDSSLEKVSNALDKIIDKNRIGIFASLFTGQAGTKGTEDLVRNSFAQIDSARSAAQEAVDKAHDLNDPKAAAAATVAAYTSERSAILQTIDTLNAEYNTRKKLQDGVDAQKKNPQFGENGESIITGGDQTANLTMLGKSVQLAQQDLRNLDGTMKEIKDNSAIDALRDQASGLKNAAKEAALEWKQLLVDYRAFQAAEDSLGHKATPQQNLGFLQSRESTINPLNRDKLSALELPQQNAIAGQQFKDNETDKLTDQVNSIGLYSNALKIASDMNRILQAAKKKNVDLSDDEIKAYEGLVTQIVSSKDYTNELQATYEEVNVPLEKYRATLAAIFTLSQRGQLTQAQTQQGIAQTTKAYEEATSAIAKYQHELADQSRDAGNRTGTDKQIQLKTSLGDIDKSLRQPGIDSDHPFGYSDADIAKANDALGPLLKAQQDKNALDEAANKLMNEESNLLDKITLQQQALTQAVAAGAISQERANNINIQARNDLNNLQLANGTATSQKSPFVGALGDFVSQFTTIAAQIKSIYSDVFKTLADGFADSIGRAIVYSKNLGDALKEVARSAIQELISGLIKLGIQYTINEVLQESAVVRLAAVKAAAASAGAVELASVTSASIIEGETTAAAWAPAATAVSLATFGANSAPAIAGITAADLVALPMYASGGLISGAGTGTSDSILAQLSNGEYVVNAAAASRHRDTLDAINSGGTPSSAPVTRTSGNGGGSNMRVTIEDHTGGVKFVTQQIGANEMRIIASDAAKQAVYQHADDAVGNAISQPNSQVSKALRQNTNARRQR